MIKIYNKKVVRTLTVTDLSAEYWDDVLWIDLLDPTADEIKAIETIDSFRCRRETKLKRSKSPVGFTSKVARCS